MSRSVQSGLEATGGSISDEAFTSPQPRLVLIRHAESRWNGEGRLQGQLDPPLSDRGRAQAELLAGRLGSHRPVALYTSDLARCGATAAALGAVLGLAPIRTPELREVHLGDWQGLRRDEIAQRYPALWARWLTSPSWDLAPGGEGTGPFQDRVRTALATILSRHAEAEEIMVVTHGGVINMALGILLGLPMRDHAPFRLDNASVTILGDRHGSRVLTLLNDVCHLDQECTRQT